MTVLGWQQPDVTDPLFGHRLDSFLIERLDIDLNLIEELEWSTGGGAGVLPGGTIERSIYTEVREQCHLPIARGVGFDGDWVHTRVRVSYVGAGLSTPEVLGTFIPTAAPETHPSTHVSEELELHGMLSVLLSTMGSTFGADVGSVVTDVISEVIGGSGHQFFNVTPSSRLLKTSKVWDTSATRLQIVNDLAASIGYWSAHADEMGTIIVDPYLALGARPLAWVFDDGPDTGLYLPGWRRERDLLVPNRCFVIQRVDGIWEPLSVSAELPPEHPQSFANRGYYQDRVESDVDFSDWDAGYVRALAYLGDGIPTESRTFTHPWLPGVVLNAKVAHRRTGLPDLIGPVQTQTIHLSTGGLIETKMSGTESAVTTEGSE